VAQFFRRALKSDRFRVMGRVTIPDPKQAALLPKWREQPGMLGVRVTFTRLAGAAGWLSDGTADWLWPAAEKAGLPVMFLAPGNMRAFLKIAASHPQLPLVIDHMALSPEIAKEGKIAEALADTVAMAKYPNVSVKLSSSPLYSSQPYPFRDMTVHLKRTEGAAKQRGEVASRRRRRLEGRWRKPDRRLQQLHDRKPAGALAPRYSALRAGEGDRGL
jgi:predicted TIM-barrel fold metal-dependent hydrolase